MVIENKTRQSTLPISLILTAHKEYADCGYMKQAIDSIDHQLYPFEEKIVVCDGFSPDSVPTGWRVVRADCHNPGGARNLGLVSSKSDWILYFDADNLMTHDYTIRLYDTFGTLQGVESNIAFIYNSLEFCNEKMQATQYLDVPEYDYWKLREGNYVDACSLVRRDALEEVGGWPPSLRAHEDYALWLNLTRIGYRGQKLRGAYLRYRTHDNQRNKAGDYVYRQEEARWQSQTFCIVGLLAGRIEYLDRWFGWLEGANLPRLTDLCVLDNSNSQKFASLLQSKINTLNLSGKFNKISQMCCKKVCSGVQEIGRHKHVAMLYNRILPDINADFVVTFEDDVLPQSDSLWKLFRPFSNHTRLAAVGAAIPARDRPTRCIAAQSADYWSDTPSVDEVKGKTLHVNYIGGGFTIWANWILKKCLPFRVRVRHGLMDGWDGFLCRMIRSDGQMILLDGKVPCKHGDIG